MPLVFTDEFAALPASCAPDKMHIIDAGRLTPAEYHSENINVWDSVATVLFKISPKVLSSFLDSHGSSYKVIMTPQPSSGRLRNLIWRKETQFMVSMSPHIFSLVS